MSLARNRAVGHRACGEALDNVLHRFNFLERNRLAAIFFGGLDAEQPAYGQQLFVLLIQDFGILLELLTRVAAHRMLQKRYGLWSPAVRLAANTVGIFTANFERCTINRRVAERVPMAAHAFLGDFRQARTLDCCRGAKEKLVDKHLLQANCVKNLRAAIALIGGNAHLGHHLQQALIYRLDEALHHFISVNLLGKLRPHCVQRFKCQIGVDRLRTIAREAGKVMHFTRFAGFHNQTNRCAQSLADQVMVHCCRRQQGWNRDAIRSHHPV